MFFKLAIHNVRRSLRDYAIYFFNAYVWRMSVLRI